MILVTGVTGNVGRQVVSALVAHGSGIRALSRNPDAAALPHGVEVVRGDLSMPSTLDACLDGVDTVFLNWPVPFLTAEAAPAALDVIHKHARRIVYLSAIGVPDDYEPQTDVIREFAAIEHLIEESGLEWTFLRPSGFAANTLAWAPAIRANGVVRWPYGAAARSLIHEQDIAAVAVRALVEDEHAGAKYVLTGPQSLTQIEQVHTIGEAIGRRLRYEEIPREAARRQMITDGWPPSLADGALDAWADMVTNPEPVTDMVEKVTGASARTFREWASDHAGDFR